MQEQNVQLQNVNMEGEKLFIRASAPSQDVKNRVSNQIKLVDPDFSTCSRIFKRRRRQRLAAAKQLRRSVTYLQPGF
jgi:hypothetical protein